MKLNSKSTHSRHFKNEPAFHWVSLDVSNCVYNAMEITNTILSNDKRNKKKWNINPHIHSLSLSISIYQCVFVYYTHMWYIGRWGWGWRWRLCSWYIIDKRINAREFLFACFAFFKFFHFCFCFCFFSIFYFAFQFLFPVHIHMYVWMYKYVYIRLQQAAFFLLLFYFGAYSLNYVLPTFRESAHNFAEWVRWVRTWNEYLN